MRACKRLAFASAIVLMPFTTTALAKGLELTAPVTGQPVTLDGVAEDAWRAAKPLTVSLDETTYKPDNGYDGITRTEVEIRALRDAENLYLLVRYADPTQSFARWPWVKQADGSWQRMANKDGTGHENTWYEDKIALFWLINEKGFKKKGCEQSCHTAENGRIEGIADTSAGRHYTYEAGEVLDMWHWKSVRTGPHGQMDDQFLNSDRGDSHKNWGRHSDSKTAESGGGYYDNVNEAKTGPGWMAAQVDEGRHWIREADKVPFDDALFKPGDKLAGVVTAPLTGPRADVAARGAWRDGVWTIEIRRPLVTTGENAKAEDVRFDDLGKPYYFGLAVFDNSQINHLFHKKSIKLSFE